MFNRRALSKFLLAAAIPGGRIHALASAERLLQAPLPRRLPLPVSFSWGSDGAYLVDLSEPGRRIDLSMGHHRMVFAHPNGRVGSIQTDGSKTHYAVASDYRLKVAP